MRRTAAKLLAVAALATSLATVAAGTSVADPASLPNSQDIVGVGSDTTQAVLNQLSTDYNATLTDPNAPHLYSWDAIPTGTITTKAGATPITRPNGSGAGITALNGNTSATVDFARSSRGRAATDPATDDFIALAKDAVTWSAVKGGHAPAQLSAAQLKAIYQCTTTNWTQIDPTLPSATIHPILPQASSGTRSFFLGAIGNPTLGSCVVTGPQENEGVDPLLLNDADAVFPYSVAHYLGQTVGGHSTPSDAVGNLTLRNIYVSPTVTLTPVTNGVINTAFSNSSFGRVVYNVLRDAEWTATDAHGTALRAIFGPDGWICNDAVATADLKSYGFLPTPACGTAF
ncbi:PstS family phosphate ABC transporter substrate-binding protein [Streptomyces sp. FH025]|uniref:PstS family phosphate ABC transporter substrate-binding protein n=1 Tax=Streptomyces sp. FH025 TaxID=2815937 RepID=UPI001A9F27D8|nr:substrate-binding domain-containing protein [Streptomyces sp. FH025]MBO1416166.1 substrate-binding domain-containing protein [Streptomyces sp. FH025]